MLTNGQSRLNLTHHPDGHFHKVQGRWPPVLEVLLGALHSRRGLANTRTVAQVPDRWLVGGNGEYDTLLGSSSGGGSSSCRGSTNRTRRSA
jgi:hypothetical protein